MSNHRTLRTIRLRVPAAKKALVRRAAPLMGMSVHEFMLYAALKEACFVLGVEMQSGIKGKFRPSRKRIEEIGSSGAKILLSATDDKLGKFYEA